MKCLFLHQIGNQIITRLLHTFTGVIVKLRCTHPDVYPALTPEMGRTLTATLSVNDVKEQLKLLLS